MSERCYSHRRRNESSLGRLDLCLGEEEGVHLGESVVHLDEPGNKPYAVLVHPGERFFV